MIVDLRSDTLTQPTPEMLEAMFAAEVGDDVYEEDPTVLLLQEKAANLFGMDTALFCPSGTMCNQIAIRLGTSPQSEVICDKRSHIYLYEAGGIASNSLSSVKLVEGKRGKIHPNQIEDSINPPDMHYPISSMVSLENTVNKGGGAVYSLAEIREISSVCKKHGLHLHIDGARIFNALVETADDPKEYGKYCDTLSFCLSKGLGAPIGSLLLMREKHQVQAKRIRKTMGGAMRQAGYLAAAGLYALEHNIERLKEDHDNARKIARSLTESPVVLEVMPVDTNIILFRHDTDWKTQKAMLEGLKKVGIKASPFGPSYIRFVTHLDISGPMVEYTCQIIQQW